MELQLELANRGARPLALYLGHLAPGGAVLAAGLQSETLGGWAKSCVLHCRGKAKQCMAMFLPAWQAVKMPILGSSATFPLGFQWISYDFI